MIIVILKLLLTHRHAKCFKKIMKGTFRKKVAFELGFPLVFGQGILDKGAEGLAGLSHAKEDRSRN